MREEGLANNSKTYIYLYPIKVIKIECLFYNFSLQRLMACALSSVIILDLSLCFFVIGIILFISSFKSKKEIKKMILKFIISIISYLLPFKILTRKGFLKKNFHLLNIFNNQRNKTKQC